ncbi:conserved hypothetical protein [Trichinella spiralis]|uniref:hypothetical protein n=1 Tax=Trichinella spiralis TaxID=6334 RepID=UPI0001EFC31C|nr:conserved hypothetical protein [Trichinella spiralis]
MVKSGVDGVVLKRQQMLYSEWSTCHQLLKRLSNHNQKHSIPSHPLLSPGCLTVQQHNFSCDIAEAVHISNELSPAIQKSCKKPLLSQRQNTGEYDLGVDGRYRTDRSEDAFDF